jgi:ketosteroid isomerase-like protein
MLMTLTVLVSACTTVTDGGNAGNAAAVSTPAQSSTPAAASRAVVAGYIAALNRRDLLALTAYVTPDVEWYSMVNGERLLELSGREALEKSLAQFFERYAKTRWVIETMQVVEGRGTPTDKDRENSGSSGVVVGVAERSEWNEGGLLKARSSLGVYELSDGRIRRITYFLNGG